jgi:hypothetical protein
MSCLIYSYNRVLFSRSPDYTKMFAFGSTWGRRRSSFSVTIVLGAVPRNKVVGIIDEAE